MSQNYYLTRTLFNGDQQFSETELLKVSNYIVILAEPGAGKTELMKSLAQQLGSRVVTANSFSHMEAASEGTPLIIDAFDELAKVDATGIHKLLAKASRANPTHLIISSRSSEWDISSTSDFKQVIGHAPTVARLCEFDQTEQKEIYTSHTKNDNFIEFQVEITRFSLEPLLPNPQFLKLFADAYTECKGRFEDKRSIFTQAITSLAKEANADTKPTHCLSRDQKIDLSSEIFAKLLLSGAEGISISEANEDGSYPQVGSLFGSGSDATNISAILATRLFKPGDNADQHRPVHKIVAEYCAADYLIKRINKSSDPLTIEQLLPIIAPNSTVRIELRGLIGWMAALGSKSIEEAVIDLDPYAVIANGDPSQLDRTSKALLLKRLKELETADPYFRRSDSWRRFSVVGLLTEDVKDEVRSIICGGDNGHLRHLLLELMIGTTATGWLDTELQQLLLSSTENNKTRQLASQCLLKLDSYDCRSDLSDLITEASSSSLAIAANIIKSIGTNAFTLNELEAFFRGCAGLYPSHRQGCGGSLGSRYFVRNFISVLNELQLEDLLDSLSKGLACNCGKRAYKCECRIGLSKIIGLLLDRYFELAKPPFEPLRIWQWLEHLNFPNKHAQNFKSVQVLKSDNALRQGIISHVFVKLTNGQQINQVLREKFSGYHSHGGLCLTLADRKFIIDLAFKGNNSQLWESFLVSHDFHNYSDKKGPDNLRSYMREQASNEPALMKIWALFNRRTQAQAKADFFSSAKQQRLMNRRDKNQKINNATNISFIQANRALIESGQHFGFLYHFAEVALNKPESIKLRFGDEPLVRKSLRNCLGFIEPQIPDLQKLAELQCDSRFQHVETILYAACIEIMRVDGNLSGVKFSLLLALRTNLNMQYPAVSQEEAAALKSEVDRLLFPDNKAAETFLIDYLVPQLAQNKCAHPQVYLLGDDEVFSPLKAKLSIQWLDTFYKLEGDALNTLFNIAAKSGNREVLNNIIKLRCDQLYPKQSEPKDDEQLKQKRDFWFIRAFYFLSLDESKPYWNFLKGDKNSLLLFNNHSGQLSRVDYPSWPELTSHKVAAILLAFFHLWPKVPLPTPWGTMSPVGETAYRFLKDIIWTIGNDSPDEAVSALNTLLDTQFLADIHMPLKTIHAEQLRRKALINFKPPNSTQVVDLLDNNAVVTVEGLRSLVLSELINYQKDIDGGEFNPVNRFYTKNESGDDIHLGEVPSCEIIAQRLKLLLRPQSITITAEHQTKNQKRIDITAAKFISGERRLLVIEAKGQWHEELYSAAKSQLYDRYSIHPDAAHQGIYLVIWFGANEKVANKKRHKITSASELKISLEDTLPPELKGFIDIFVLDVSRT